MLLLELVFYFFTWEIVWGRILTVDTLMKRGWKMVNKCSFCKDTEEFANHILIHCDKTRNLWTFLLAVFGLVWVLPALVRNLLLQWKIKKVKGLHKKKTAVWCLAQICLFWCIWKEHNWRVFEDEELSHQRVKDFFIWLLLEWSQDSLELENPLCWIS